ncbi:MAG: L-seryl-tRNA(Sec) selenium transferase [Dehalococcoidales bacterium]|nr:L-seryl-tRNA(Sec) selenium transferase [Dehalococcoidales bacterium]
MEMKFRSLPAVDKVLSDERIDRLAQKYPHDLLVGVVRECLEHERASIVAGKAASSLDGIISSVIRTVQSLEKPTLRPVINASGVIIHTNLGRAPLSAESLAAMEKASRGYSNLEFNLENGTRGSRHVHVEELLCRLSGAEAAMVVNNNAAGVMLGLTALARRKEVIVSRGQAVEIGGSFRIPDVMRQSGAKLVEVGTTNCTYAADYEQAISPRTAAIIRVHSSNFRLVGFINEVTLEELVDIGKRNDIVILDDLGSGCFLDTTAFGLEPEPMVQQSVDAGVALTFFSGDKLVGGPQAGIIVGKKQYVDRLKKHPLARAVRTDKTRLAALAATLLHYLKGEAAAKVPVWRMISTPLEDIEKRAGLWVDALGDTARIVPGKTMVGGGSLPGGSLPTKLVAITGGAGKGGSVQSIAARLRRRDIPVIGRISEDVLLLDPRTVLPEEDDMMLEALRDISGSIK